MGKTPINPLDMHKFWFAPEYHRPPVPVKDRFSITQDTIQRIIMELKDSPERPPRLEKFKQCVANFDRLFNQVFVISKSSRTKQTASIKTSCSKISFNERIEEAQLGWAPKQEKKQILISPHYTENFPEWEHVPAILIECTKQLDPHRNSNYNNKKINIMNFQDITIKKGFYNENWDFIEESFSPNANLINKVMDLMAKATHLDIDIQTNRHNFSISSSLANTLILQTSEELLWMNKMNDQWQQISWNFSPEKIAA